MDERAVSGPVLDEAAVASRAPFAVAVEAGKKYWWCACGRSKSQPFCDGSHKGSAFRPVEFQATRTEWRWFCGCKRSQGRPFCDGSHKALPVATTTQERVEGTRR